MSKKLYFHNKLLPYFLVAPQILITIVFFLWPAYMAIEQSLFLEDPFGLNPPQFVGLENFTELFSDSDYTDTFVRTLMFSLLVSASSMGVALVLAGFADRIIRGTLFYQTFLIMPYAVAPVLAGGLWLFLFDPTLGLLTFILDFFGYDWNHKLNGSEAMTLVVIASSWNRISYNFLFFIAAIQSIPKSLIEAASLDGANAFRRYIDIMLPLISPTAFFLLVMNTVYSFFETFSIIDAITKGGPESSTEILVYKVYNDGFIGLNLGSSAAQSVILLALVITLTFVQFRYVEKKVNYA